MPDIISSGSNPRIRKLVELQKKAKVRRETGLFVIEGTRLCSDTPPQYIKEVYATENRIKNKPSKADTAASGARLIDEDRHYRLVSLPGEIPFDNYLRIDNTDLSPREAAVSGCT